MVPVTDDEAPAASDNKAFADEDKEDRANAAVEFFLSYCQITLELCKYYCVS